MPTCEIVVQTTETKGTMTTALENELLLAPNQKDHPKNLRGIITPRSQKLLRRNASFNHHKRKKKSWISQRWK
ncbi:hypothetical protein L3Y34_019625 [Caenorhabditis briggsae]|uniref:Uncharacterized protein n=1 Tax=Caenorhabditis briggsae TaxID=6238 RepID=A0AAE9DNM6_CAEBR|nr:hypothetical protein L3Y34_019625 [Caenorhabditis briggsae]